MKRLVRVSGESMAPTYRSSDLLLTRPVGRGGVERGDVVVFRHGQLRMIKRVVGLPGDLLELEAGRLFVNGEPVDGRPRVPGAYSQTWRVPATSYFMAGDNPAVSDDSRVWEEPFVTAESVETVVTRPLVGLGRLKDLPDDHDENLRRLRPFGWIGKMNTGGWTHDACTTFRPRR